MEMVTCWDALIPHQALGALFGMPAHLTSDQGAQFPSSLWERTCEVIGTIGWQKVTAVTSKK